MNIRIFFALLTKGLRLSLLAAPVAAVTLTRNPTNVNKNGVKYLYMILTMVQREILQNIQTRTLHNNKILHMESFYNQVVADKKKNNNQWMI